MLLLLAIITILSGITFPAIMFLSLNNERRTQHLLEKTLNHANRFRHVHGRVIRLAFGKSANQ